MSKIRVVIIDDAAPARRLLRLMLKSIAPDIEIAGEASNALEGEALIITTKPDVVFLDIEMPGKSGVQLATELTARKIPFNVVFTTAYNEYAITAFRLSAVDYLLKPIHEKHLEEALVRVRSIHGALHNEILLRTLSENISKEKPHSIAIPVVSGFENVLLDKLMYIKADGSYAHVVQEGNRTLTVAKNLKYFDLVLEGDSRFMRIHRSFIINLQHVLRFESTGKGAVIMKDGAALDVARERKDAFRARFSGK